MIELAVECYTPDDPDEDLRLQGVGGYADGGWFLPIDEAIQMLLNGEVALFVVGHGPTTRVIVATHETSGRLYLTTRRDESKTNNLSNLETCPPDFGSSPETNP